MNQTRSKENGRSLRPAGPQLTELTLAETIIRYVGILYRYRWWIGIVTFFAAGGIVAFSIVSLRLPPEESPMPNTYEAQATLLMGEDPLEAGASAILEALGMATMESRTALTSGRLALQVLESRAFIDTIIERNAMVARYGLEDMNNTRRRAFVRARSDYAYEPPTALLTISYRDIHPEYTRQVVDSMVAELTQWFSERDRIIRGRTLEALETTLAEVEREITALESEIRAFQQRYGVLGVEEIASSQAAMLRTLENELVQLERAIRTAAERTRLRDDPELIRLRSERDTVIDLMRQVEAGHAGGDRTTPARSELPDLALRLSRLQSDIEIQQRIRTSLQEQYELARLTASAPPAFTILESAEVPDEKVAPSRARLCVTVTLAAFAASVTLALIHDAFKSAKLKQSRGSPPAAADSLSTPDSALEPVTRRG